MPEITNYINLEDALNRAYYISHINENFYPEEKYVINIEDILTLPICDVVKVKHAHWETLHGEFNPLDDCGCPKYRAWCSNCGDFLTGSDEYATRGRYCPNCGALMDGGVNNN